MTHPVPSRASADLSQSAADLPDACPGKGIPRKEPCIVATP